MLGIDFLVKPVYVKWHESELMLFFNRGKKNSIKLFFNFVILKKLRKTQTNLSFIQKRFDVRNKRKEIEEILISRAKRY